MKKKIIIHLLLATLLITFSGCSFIPKDKDKVLVKVGKKSVTVFDYKQALELAKTAYPHNVTQNPAEFKIVLNELLHDLVEELILQNAAESMGVTISKEALKAEVDRIKADYPDNTFEQMLLENAIPYDAWEDRLRIQLLMDKVINEALIKNVVVTPEETKEYYNSIYLPEHGGVPEEGMTEEQITKSILENLKRKKAEDAYEDWLGKVQSQYKIDINKAEWQKIISQNAG
ncbi:SurA N-terminal domain-containing protein [Desulforegula conservatrix]|uniref:SurA N-terminal domain-containing protein n=1 Tax=Desulforegula conservatrix TaxID=153026 RepID=UPI00041B2823|nr:SurA N-terminal domain-containing protein [Desulforegula conservatrix]